MINVTSTSDKPLIEIAKDCICYLREGGTMTVKNNYGKESFILLNGQIEIYAKNNKIND